MPALPPPVQNLVNALERLPGIGPKSASRLAFYMLRAPDEIPLDLAKALQDNRLLDLPLSPLFYRLALQRRVDLFDIRRLDSSLGERS